MNKMSTEEYYSAINKRLQSIREVRKQSNDYSREEFLTFEESLNRKNRTGQ